MKRSEMLLHMQRFYGIRHVMLESGYITLKDFMSELLEYMESKGMQPPEIETEHWNREDNNYHKAREWENEEK
jgi:hypothetical protein